MILVVGTGRCGSSTVARLLHERFNVSMGSLFPPPNEFNPQGYYEDVEFRTAQISIMSGDTDFVPWINWLRGYIHRRKMPGGEWGVKDDILSYLGPLWLAMEPDGRVIWCRRPHDKVAASMRGAARARKEMRPRGGERSRRGRS